MDHCEIPKCYDILIVEENEDFLDYLEGVIEQVYQGKVFVDATKVSDFDSAIIALERYQFDVIFLDPSIGDGYGKEILNQRAKLGINNIPIIVTNASCELENINHEELLFLNRPFNEKQINLYTKVAFKKAS